MSKRMPILRLLTDRNSEHPWIFRDQIRAPRDRIENGTFVEIQNRAGRFAGFGIYNSKSKITLRVLSERQSEPLNEDFFVARLERAAELRESILKINDNSNAYRLVHSESDGLSGLVVDKFDDVLVIKPYSAGYTNNADLIVSALRKVFGDVRVGIKMDDTVAKREGIDATRVMERYPLPESVIIKENNLQMKVDFQTGHKTGYFLDQRENRLRISELSKDAEVLDLFSYTGGFAISAALGGASRVRAVDLDEKAISTAEENAKLNNVEVEFTHRDVFDYLRRMQQDNDCVDVMIIDPAKFASVKDELKRAKRAYGDVNKLGFSCVRDGGVVVTCSCSGLIGTEEFLSIISRSARDARVRLQIMEVAGASRDHPVISNFPEGQYLKAVFARVYRK